MWSFKTEIPLSKSSTSSDSASVIVSDGIGFDVKAIGTEHRDSTSSGSICSYSTFYSDDDSYRPQTSVGTVNILVKFISPVIKCYKLYFLPTSTITVEYKKNNNTAPITVCEDTIQTTSCRVADESKVWLFIKSISLPNILSTSRLLISGNFVVIVADDVTSPFSCLYNDTEMTDLTLVCNDGAVEVHKIVLAASSPMFKRMFLGDWKDSKTSSMTVADVSCATLKCFKLFLYENKLVDNENIEELLELTSRYLVDNVEDFFISNFIGNISQKTAYRFLHYAMKFKMHKVLMMILNSIKVGNIEVSNIESFVPEIKEIMPHVVNKEISPAKKSKTTKRKSTTNGD